MSAKRKTVDPVTAVAGERFRQVCYSSGERMPKDMIAKNKEMVVVSNAGRSCQAGLWCCLSHGIVFVNNMEKDTHIGSQTKPCTLGWFCATHGEVEEP